MMPTSIVVKKKEKKASPFTPAQMRAMVALSAGASRAEAARVAGSRPETITHWLNTPAFAKELREQQRQNLENVLLDLDSAALGALQVLTEQMGDAELDPKLRQGAAKAVLDRATFARQRIEVTAPKQLADLDPVDVARGALSYLAAQGAAQREAVVRALLDSPVMREIAVRFLEEDPGADVLDAEFENA